MANFSALKTAIQNAIKQNGNEEITGDVLQQILLSIVSTMGDGAINTIEQNLSNEATTRQGADTQLQNAINAIKAKIDNGYVYAGIATPSTTPVSGKVFYIATAAGTYTNFGGQVLTQGINILRYNGSSWSHQQLIGIDDVPTVASNSLAKSGGVQNELALGAVYDVSAKNPTAGPNNDGKWESLSALLSDANLNTLIPTAYRKGGMSIKFVHTYDNKYVEFRYTGTSIANADFTNVDNWQSMNVDRNITPGSNNAIESGAVYNAQNYPFVDFEKTATNNSYKYFVKDCYIYGNVNKTHEYRISQVYKAKDNNKWRIALNDITLGAIVARYNVQSNIQNDGVLFMDEYNGGGVFGYIVVDWSVIDNTEVSNIDVFLTDKIFDVSNSKEIDRKNSIEGWILSESFNVTGVTRDSNDNVSYLSVVWPDGTSGSLTITRDSDGLAISVSVVYGTDNYNYTITRDSNGDVVATSLVKQ